MSSFPHIYTTTAEGSSDDYLTLSVEGLPSMVVSSPPEFGGPKGYWNPEAFFSAAISTCFILTYKFVAKKMKLAWNNILVDVDAYLDNTEGKLSFTKAKIFVTLVVAEGVEEETAIKALHKAKETCLITNSITSEIDLEAKITIDR